MRVRVLMWPRLPQLSLRFTWATNMPPLRGSGRSDNGKANDLSSLWTLVVVSFLVRMIMQGSNCVLSIYDLVMNFERKIKACRSKQIYAGFCDL